MLESHLLPPQTNPLLNTRLAVATCRGVTFEQLPVLRKLNGCNPTRNWIKKGRPGELGCEGDALVVLYILNCWILNAIGR